MTQTHLLLGANLGDRTANLQKAFQLLEEKVGKVVKHSQIYETEPWGITGSPNFLNQAVLAETLLSPVKLIRQVLEIETSMGRNREEEKWAPRTIDIDILFYDQLILRTDSLLIPHPHITDRKFALVPLDEMDPQFKHPVSKKTMSELNSACTDTLKVWLHK